MNPKDLTKVWDAPDQSKLALKQTSVRLPILVAAKINALCELYPRKNKSEVICDLLSTALDQLEDGMESIKGGIVEYEPGPRGGHIPLYEDIGLRGRFRSRTIKYLRELEKEADIKEPTAFYEMYLSGDEVP